MEIPQQDWGLKQWVEAAGGATFSYLADLAYEISGLEWKVPTISEWMQGSNKSLPGIARRDDAVVMISVLRTVALQHHRTLFENEAIVEQARIFLKSKACKQKFAELEQGELETICQDSDGPYIQASYERLRSRVQPLPPRHLFGRNPDLERVITSVEKHPVTMITGIGGEGKTSLAWFAATELINSQLCVQLDWTTDKRYIVDADGNIRNLTNAPLDFEGILRSMVHTFGWHKLIGIQDLEVLKNRCGEHLRNGRYLIVIDNLETVDDCNEIVDLLKDMLAPSGPRAPLTSRAIMTSRVRLSDPRVAHVDIEGIQAIEWLPYLHALGDTAYPDAIDLLTEEQAARLGTATAGNPLFMCIALFRYMLAPTDEQFNRMIQGLLEGKTFVQVFRSLFEGLAEQLSPGALLLATYASKVSMIKPLLERDLRRVWDTNASSIYPDSDLMEEKYYESLRQLLNCRILNRQQDQYTIHTLIRSYFLASSL